MPDRPLRDLTTGEVQAFVDDGVVCVRGVMPAAWLELVAGAIERNIAEPTAIGQFISIPEKGFLNDIFMWLAGGDHFPRLIDAGAAAERRS